MQVVRNIILSMLLLFSLTGAAQFKSAMIGVNGLTCSACTRSVEMSIRKLKFVKEVEMNLENTEGKIIFTDNIPVDISKIAQAVRDAGFSVRYVKATTTISNFDLTQNNCLEKADYNLQFINVTEKKLNGEITVKFLGNDFQTKNGYNLVKAALVNKCGTSTRKTYFVTL